MFICNFSNYILISEKQIAVCYCVTARWALILKPSHTCECATFSRMRSTHVIANITSGGDDEGRRWFGSVLLHRGSRYGGVSAG